MYRITKYNNAQNKAQYFVKNDEQLFFKKLLPNIHLSAIMNTVNKES